jgi:nucleoid DNA-binding protein
MAKTSVLAREELLGRVQVALHLPTRGDAQHLTNLVIACVEDTLLAHLADDGFAMKLNSFGKFVVHHRPAGWKRVGFSGEVVRMKRKAKVKFVSLGRLRQFEDVEGARELDRRG